MKPTPVLPPFRARPKRQHRQRKWTTSTTTPPAALELTSATYATGTSLTLAFNRAIDISGLVGSQITVDDGALSGSIWEASGAVTIVNPTTITIGLVELEGSGSPDTMLYANPENGIVAAGDESPWDGTEGTALPFP